MTAKQLYDLTKPLFDKHPSAKPDCLEYREIAERWVSVYEDTRNIRASNGVLDDHAAIIIQGHLIQWLTTGRTCEITTMGKEACVAVYGAGRHYASTLLEALVAACMEVPA